MADGGWSQQKYQPRIPWLFPLVDHQSIAIWHADFLHFRPPGSGLEPPCFFFDFDRRCDALWVCRLLSRRHARQVCYGLVRLLIAAHQRYICGPHFFVSVCFSFAFYQPRNFGAEPPCPLAAHIAGWEIALHLVDLMASRCFRKCTSR